MREMRDASGEGTRRAAKPRERGVRLAGLGASLSSPSPTHLAPRSRGFATRVSHLAHKTQTRVCSQAICILISFSLVFVFLSSFYGVGGGGGVQVK